VCLHLFFFSVFIAHAHPISFHLSSYDHPTDISWRADLHIMQLLRTHVFTCLAVIVLNYRHITTKEGTFWARSPFRFHTSYIHTFVRKVLNFSTSMTIHYFIILLRRVVFPKSSFVAGNPKIPFLIPRNPHVLKRCQARKQTTASSRTLLQYVQFPDQYFHNFSRDIGIFRSILQFLCIYSTIHRRTTNDVLRNPGCETGPYSKRWWWFFYFIFTCRHIVTDCSKLKVR